MAKIKTAKKAAKLSAKKETAGNSLLSKFFHKKNRPLQGVTLGSVLVLLHSFWAVLALVGWGLIALSAIAFFAKKKEK